jgi:hypothetical protein
MLGKRVTSTDSKASSRWELSEEDRIAQFTESARACGEEYRRDVELLNQQGYLGDRSTQLLTTVLTDFPEQLRNYAGVPHSFTVGIFTNNLAFEQGALTYQVTYHQEGWDNLRLSIQYHTEIGVDVEIAIPLDELGPSYSWDVSQRIQGGTGLINKALLMDYFGQKSETMGANILETGKDCRTTSVWQHIRFLSDSNSKITGVETDIYGYGYTPPKLLGKMTVQHGLMN